MHDDEHQAAKPTEDTSAPVTVRFTRAQAESLSDGRYGPPEDLWPGPDWIKHEQAHSAALAAVEDALNGDDGPDVIELLEHAQELLDHALHAELARAARAADHVAIGDRLHAVDGCWIAQQAHPLAVEPGGYRRDRIPRYLTSAEGERWLRAIARRARCRRCWPSRG
jgi:hypothetical protein